jgi:hypothetical protein
MYCRALILAAAAALLAVSAVPADDEKPAPEKPKAGLKDGADLPGPFRPYNVNGRYEKKFHCLTNEHGLNPGVLIFAQNVNTEDKTGDNANLPNLLRELDKYIVDRPKTRLNAFAVYLFNDMPDVVTNDDVREVHAAQLAKLKGDEPALQQVVLGLDSAPALQKAGYTISPEDQVIVVLYDQLKVAKVYTFKQAMKKMDVDAIMKEVKEHLAPFKK